jgi:putative peptidoglycan lipid II flippase
MKLMVPALFGVSVSQLNLLLDTLIASFLVSGSISWLYYSDRLMEFPVGILGVALGTVILPKLSRNHAEKSPEEFSATLDWALRLMILLGIPSAVGLIMLAGPVMATLFYSDAFSDHDVVMASLSLMAYAPGLVAFILIKVLAPGFYARQDTKTPVRYGIITMVVNMVLNILLVFPLAHVGLALATSLSSALNAFLLYRGLVVGGIYRPGANWKKFILQVSLAAFAMGGLIYLVAGELETWLAMTTWERITYLSLWIALPALLYFSVLLITGMRAAQLKRAPVE